MQHQAWASNSDNCIASDLLRLGPGVSCGSEVWHGCCSGWQGLLMAMQLLITCRSRCDCAHLSLQVGSESLNDWRVLSYTSTADYLVEQMSPNQHSCSAACDGENLDVDSVADRPACNVIAKMSQPSQQRGCACVLSGISRHSRRHLTGGWWICRLTHSLSAWRMYLTGCTSCPVDGRRECAVLQHGSLGIGLQPLKVCSLCALLGGRVASQPLDHLQHVAVTSWPADPSIPPISKQACP